MTHTSHLLLLGDVARLLGIKPYRITYALTAGLVEEPHLRIKRQRVFQSEDVARLADHFGVELEQASNRVGGANE